MSTWNIDGSHTTASFTARHMMITNVRGHFEKVSGTVEYDAEHPEATKLDITIDASSINTREEKRDGHLKSADFFDVENHPNVTFKSKSAKKTDDGITFVGDLTMRGITHEVTLVAEGPTAPHKDPWGGTRIGATARAKVKRSEWNMVWNNVLEAGGVLVSDEVKIEIEVSLVKA